MIGLGIGIAVVISLIVGFAAGWGARTQGARQSLGSLLTKYNELMVINKGQADYIRTLEVKAGVPPRARDF